MPKPKPIIRADGITRSEHYLKRLCDRTFLSLWSYPGVCRDDGVAKEICDLLVVFEDHIIIFSDKACVFPETGDLDRDWSRWYRRAIEKSAQQVWGAERWIKQHPDRLFLDRSCAQPFPIDLPNVATARFHRVVVAHHASSRCQRELGGSGSLMIIPEIQGDQHYLSEAAGGMPFTVGRINPARGYVHVLDDITLDIVLTELDTITDFVAYLTKKEEMILAGRLEVATGEEDLLAYYLWNLNEAGEHDFVMPSETDHLGILEGLWAEFVVHPQRYARLEADKISYTWDRLIEAFSTHLYAGTQFYATQPGLRHSEKIMRFMAR